MKVFLPIFLNFIQSNYISYSNNPDFWNFFVHVSFLAGKFSASSSFSLIKNTGDQISTLRKYSSNFSSFQKLSVASHKTASCRVNYSFSNDLTITYFIKDWMVQNYFLKIKSRDLFTEQGRVHICTKWFDGHCNIVVFLIHYNF